MKIIIRAAFAIALLLFAGAQVWAAENQEQGMGREEAARKTWEKWHGAMEDDLAKTDPELAEARSRLLYGEILNGGSLSDRQRALVIIAALTASQAWEELPDIVNAALNLGVSPLEIREAIYQCAPYTGFPRVARAIRLANGCLVARGVSLPLENAATVTESTRPDAGMKVQKSIFGNETIDSMHKNASEKQKPLLVNYLSAWCFGDFYTRKALDLKMRELVTFSAIVALGGCNPQAEAHAGGNLAVGNTGDNLVDALATMLPFIGYPRTLNGLGCVNAALRNAKK